MLPEILGKLRNTEETELLKCKNRCHFPDILSEAEKPFSSGATGGTNRFQFTGVILQLICSLQRLPLLLPPSLCSLNCHLRNEV